MAAVSARVSESDFLQAALALFPEAFRRGTARHHQIRQLKRGERHAQLLTKAQSAMPLAVLLVVAAVTSPLEQLLDDVDAMSST